MKKRKKPVVLVAVFLLLFGVVAAMNSSILSEPQTPEELKNQQQREELKKQKEQQKQNPAPAAKVKGDSGPGQSLAQPKADHSEQDELPMNFKSIPAVDPKGPKIAAPKVFEGKVKSADQASTQANGQWYRR